MKRSITAFFFLFFALAAFAHETTDSIVEKSTYVFAEKDTSILKLDKYRLKSSKEKQPCLFFVFGGGFINGKRDDKSAVDYFNYFAKRGFTVVAIDYRLGMRGQKGIGITNYKPLENAIDMAVDDLYDATSFAINHSEEWNIDTSRVILSGSSAGAVTVLQAEYENRNKLSASQKLPQQFQYAGVISYSGAIFSTDGGLKWNSEACPIMMFHGEKDKVVPYNKIRFFKIGFFGSKTIAGKLKKYGFPYLFTTYKGAAHEVSSFPMRENREEVLSFINTYIFGGRKLQADLNIKELDRSRNKKKDSYKDLYNKKK